MRRSWKYQKQNDSSMQLMIQQNKKTEPWHKLITQYCGTYYTHTDAVFKISSKVGITNLVQKTASPFCFHGQSWRCEVWRHGAWFPCCDSSPEPAKTKWPPVSCFIPNLQFIAGRKEIGKRQAQVWFTVHYTGHFRSVEDSERKWRWKNTKDRNAMGSKEEFLAIRKACSAKQ